MAMREGGFNADELVTVRHTLVALKSSPRSRSGRPG